MKRKYFNLGKDMRIVVSTGKIQYKLYPSASRWQSVDGNIKNTKVYKFIEESYGKKDGAKRRLKVRNFLVKHMKWSIS